MFAMYELGEYFIDSLGAIGDFLLYEPIAAISVPGVMPQWVHDLVASISGVSIGEAIFGVGLIAILTFKIFKFVLDIVF